MCDDVPESNNIKGLVLERRIFDSTADKIDAKILLGELSQLHGWFDAGAIPSRLFTGCDKETMPSSYIEHIPRLPELG